MDDNQRAYELLQMLWSRACHKKGSAWLEVREAIKNSVFLTFMNEWNNIPDGYKRCTHCNEVLPKTKFYKHKGGKDGLHSQCGKCLHLPREKKKAVRERIKLENLVAVEKLSCSYIRNLMKIGTTLKASDFPEEVVDLKRKQIILTRLKKENNHYGRHQDN